MKGVADTACLESAPCALGCPPDDEAILIGRDRLHWLPGNFHVVKCRGCGLMRTNPRPTVEAIESYYPENYGPYESTKVNISRPGARKRSLVKLLDTDTREIPQLPPGRLLEIGCASGDFLHQMARLGWQVEGLELSANAAKTVRSLGYPVQTGRLETTPDPKEPYDLIVGWHVFEHLHNPVGALQRLHDWSKVGGWLALSMPDAASWEFKVFRDRWYALQVPTHLYHYTPKTLRKVLSRGGWALDRLFWHDNPNNLLQSLRYCCADRGWNRLADYLLDVIRGQRHRYFRLLLAKLLGTLRASGRMTVWAQRI
jgi:2-polyprenyl-3-methyl-5-hydroxy-6-metoxy-1,4-benzoquinol methylase